ncbi:MAG TPA: hypothetical protein VG297_26615 [Bryobacteraceae bacterium]|jgi:hypothetical protein|nr:hypothetical protein [Bryobacteraceae bacterium]
MPRIVLVGVLALASVAVVRITGQTPAASPKKAGGKSAGAVKRTAWGDPDLQGTWFVLYDTPLERPAANANKEFLTDAEVAAANQAKGLNPGRNTRATGAVDVSGAYNAVFNSILRTGKRTSLVIDPPDGRIPPLVADASPQARAQGGRGGGAPRAGAGAARGEGGAAGAGRGPAYAALPLGVAAGQNDNPETTAQSPRCLGVPMPFLPLNTAFAQGTVMQLVQSPKSVGIYMEDDHAGGGNRTILMDGRPHAPAGARFYLGDSRGHWEGNTLVVETTNFSQGFRGSNPDTYKMTERFTRVGANDLERRITFEDPKTWTRPWTVLIQMGKAADDKHMIFDSACHEGNYGMTGILAGARAEEKAAAGKK